MSKVTMDSPTLRHCIFCGRSPVEKKNKEHVIPQWLIQLTGDPKRQAYFGPRWAEGMDADRMYAFDQFVFPACKECNERYSELEGSVKQTVTRMLEGAPVTHPSLSRLLDWFDKVRVGLWLGQRLLDKNPWDIEPNFFIDQRVGQYDRMLIVERYEFDQPNLNFGGTIAPAFMFMPSAFSLTVNGLSFTNISSVGLLARRLGFPYPAKLAYLPDRPELYSPMASGRERIMNPVIQRARAERGVTLYQPMFPQGLVTADSDASKHLYDTEYVRQCSLDYEAGVGAIFIEHLGGEIRALGLDDEAVVINPVANYEGLEHHLRNIVNVCRWQDWLLMAVEINMLPTDQRRWLVKRRTFALRENKKLIKHHIKLLHRLGVR